MRMNPIAITISMEMLLQKTVDQKNQALEVPEVNFLHQNYAEQVGQNR